MEMRPQHTCPEDAQITLQSICEDGSVGASDIFIIAAVSAVLIALGVVVWFLMKRRYEE